MSRGGLTNIGWNDSCRACGVSRSEIERFGRGKTGVDPETASVHGGAELS